MKEAQVLIHLHPLIFLSFSSGWKQLVEFIWEGSINPSMIVQFDKHVTWIPTCFFQLFKLKMIEKIQKSV